MSGEILLIASILLLPLCVAGAGLCNNYRSYVLLGINSFFCAPALLGAWYSWMETRSISWTVGYGFVACLCAFAGARQFILPSGGSQQK